MHPLTTFHDREDCGPTYSFGFPEDVLIVVDEDDMKSFGWKRLMISDFVIISSDHSKDGAASYEMDNGALDMTIEHHVEEPAKAGVYVVEDITGEYFMGDGWEIDDDMTFHVGGIRPATIEEIAEGYGVDFWSSEPEQ